MSIPVALLLAGVAIVLWRCDLRLAGGILAGCVLYTLGESASPQATGAALADLGGGLSGDVLLLAIVGVGFALCCGWRPGRRAARRN